MRAGEDLTLEVFLTRAGEKAREAANMMATAMNDVNDGIKRRSVEWNHCLRACSMAR